MLPINGISFLARFAFYLALWQQQQWRCEMKLVTIRRHFKFYLPKLYKCKKLRSSDEACDILPEHLNQKTRISKWKNSSEEILSDSKIPLRGNCHFGVGCWSLAFEKGDLSVNRTVHIEMVVYLMGYLRPIQIGCGQARQCKHKQKKWWNVHERHRNKNTEQKHQIDSGAFFLPQFNLIADIFIRMEYAFVCREKSRNNAFKSQPDFFST